MKDTHYYDKESSQYSGKRYPAHPSTYVQSFYLRRLKLVLSLVGKTVRGGGLRLIEIGCADGVVTRALYDRFSDVFSDIAGVDISPKMIEEAKAQAGERRISFGLRDTYTFIGKYDLVVEVGVINYADEEEELRFARRITGDRGYYLCSIAGTSSLWNRLKPDEDKGFNNFRSYAEYEAAIREHFTILASVPVGLFTPHIWKVPALARIVQPLCESVLSPFFPNLFHEKLYLLKPL